VIAGGASNLPLSVRALDHQCNCQHPRTISGFFSFLDRWRNCPTDKSNRVPTEPAAGDNASLQQQNDEVCRNPYESFHTSQAVIP
jgi:hypothetical protein